MAKFGIALGSGPRGLGFESRCSDQIIKSTQWVGFIFCFLIIISGQFYLAIFGNCARLLSFRFDEVMLCPPRKRFETSLLSRLQL